MQEKSGLGIREKVEEFGYRPPEKQAHAVFGMFDQFGIDITEFKFEKDGASASTTVIASPLNSFHFMNLSLVFRQEDLTVSIAFGDGMNVVLDGQGMVDLSKSDFSNSYSKEFSFVS